jgi:hypothetical protein
MRGGVTIFYVGNTMTTPGLAGTGAAYFVIRHFFIDAATPDHNEIQRKTEPCAMFNSK